MGLGQTLTLPPPASWLRDLKPSPRLLGIPSVICKLKEMLPKKACELVFFPWQQVASLGSKLI